MGLPECSLHTCREIVKGSHLRPLEERDTKGSGGFRQPWNTAACREKTGGGGGEGEGEVGVVSLSNSRATLNLQSFMREWRKLSPEPRDQYRYLYVYCDSIIMCISLSVYIHVTW